MSSFPTPEIPPTPQQVAATLCSVLSASQKLISSDPKYYTELRATFTQFYYSPIFQLILGIPSQNIQTPPPQENQLKAELTNLKSTISALSKTVISLQPKAKGVQAPSTQTPPTHKGNTSAQGKGPTNITPPTYASTAVAKARPSLVLDLGTPQEDQLNSELTGDLNGLLYESGFEDIKISATRYTKKGNLVITAHHTTTQSQLNAATTTITSLVKQIYTNTNPDYFYPEGLLARANIKWSKILINSVPIRTRDRPWMPEECHRSLVAHNPAYASLTITQKPSWVRPPSTLKKGSHSSLIVAFKDPDGSAHRSLLSTRQLYLLGVRAKVSQWKEKPCPSHTHSSPTASPATSVLEPLTHSPRSSTPDAVMAEEPCSPTPSTSATRKHSLPTTSNTPKTSSSPKKKRVGSQ